MPLTPSLVIARLRRGALRWAVVIAAVALAVAMPVFSAGVATLVATRAVDHGVAQLEPGDRSVVVSFNGTLSADELARSDGVVRREVGRLAGGRVQRQLIFRRLADPSGQSYALGAGDALAARTRVLSGRLPRSCTPQRCEVAVVGNSTAPDTAELGVTVVGRVSRTDPLLLTGTFDPGSDVPLLLAGDVDSASRIEALELFQRSYGWVAPLDLSRVRRNGVSDYLRSSATAADTLSRYREGLVLVSPDAVLQSEARRADASARRLTLLGGSTAALLLGFAVVGGVGVRRDALAFAALLRRRGAPRQLVNGVTIAEAAAPVAVAGLLGVAVGAGAVALLAARLGLPTSPGVRAAVEAGVSPEVLGLLVAAVAVVAMTMLVRTGTPRSAWWVVDGVVVAMFVGVALALSRGNIGVTELVARGDPLLVALPAWGAVLGGLVAARLWLPVAAVAARHAPPRTLPLRLALTGATRRPLRSVVTVAFLTAAVASVVFAGSYRATLMQGAQDQAAFVVPLDARLTAGSTGDDPLELASTARLSKLTAGGSAFGVVRAPAALRTSATESTAVPIVGVDPGAVRRMHAWRPGPDDVTQPGASRALAGAQRQQPGPRLPFGTEFSVPATGLSDQISVTAWFRDEDGREAGVLLQLQRNTLRGALPRAGGPTDPALRLVALTFRESMDRATLRQHAIGEGDTDLEVVTGRVRLGRPSVDGRAVAGSFWSNWGATGAQTRVSGDSLIVAYRLGGALAVLAHGAASTSAPLPVLVDATTAANASAGRLTLTLAGGRAVPVRVAGVLAAFPTAGRRFAVTDRVALAEVLDRADPGAGAVREVWVGAGTGRAPELAAALKAPPYDRLSVSLRAAVEKRLATDPVAVGASGLLATGSLLALLVGALALVLLVVAELRDDAAELYAYEVDGIQPRSLRRLVFLRAVGVAVLALPVGVAAGSLLTRVTTQLIALTGAGGVPVPDLVPANGPATAGIVLLGGLALALILAALVVGVAMREPLPRPVRGDLG